MSETLQSIIANSFWIAWDYLDATHELGNPDLAAKHLLDTIEPMVRLGERRQLLLASKAITAYQRFRVEQGLSIAS
jgi:hypothetical protein